MSYTYILYIREFLLLIDPRGPMAEHCWVGSILDLIRSKLTVNRYTVTTPAACAVGCGCGWGVVMGRERMNMSHKIKYGIYFPVDSSFILLVFYTSLKNIANLQSGTVYKVFSSLNIFWRKIRQLIKTKGSRVTQKASFFPKNYIFRCEIIFSPDQRSLCQTSAYCWLS